MPIIFKQGDFAKDYYYDTIIYYEKLEKKFNKENQDNRWTEMVPLRDSTKKRITAKINLMNTIIQPTLKGINIKEIQDSILQKLYRRVVRHTDSMEECLKRANDYHDQHVCVSTFEKKVDTHVVPWIFGMLREY